MLNRCLPKDDLPIDPTYWGIQFPRDNDREKKIFLEKTVKAQESFRINRS
jgi:hypothetical protein